MRNAVDQARIDGLKQEIACLKRDLEASNIKLEKFRKELTSVRWDTYTALSNIASDVSPFDEKKQCLG